MKQLSNSELEIMIKLWVCNPDEFWKFTRQLSATEESTVRSFIQRMIARASSKRSGRA